VLHSSTGIRTERRISHVFIIDVPVYPSLLMVTDTAVNIAPDLDAKQDICQNAIDLAHTLGVEQPKVAVLAAVETIRPKMQSTLDAAALCKMADRGQIKGGLLDGPLAMDNAISLEAARIKKIDSPVAGIADILLVSNLEAGNILAKQLIFLAGSEAAGIMLGAQVPIIRTSRADSVRTRRASVATSVLYAWPSSGLTTKNRNDEWIHNLTLNAGSSSVKCALYEECAGEPVLQAKGLVESIDTTPHFIAKSSGGAVLSESYWESALDGRGHARPSSRFGTGSKTPSPVGRCSPSVTGSPTVARPIPNPCPSTPG